MSDILNKQQYNHTAHVRLLGGFELRIGDLTVTDELNRSAKLWNLLAYLITHRHRAISQTEFIEMLWPEDPDGNPVSALKTLFFRARKMLAQIFGHDIEFILSRNNSYAWNNNIDCHCDIDTLVQLCRDACDESLDHEFRAGLYRQIIEMYRGGFLPKLTSQLWTVPLRAHYHSLFIEAARQFAGILRVGGRLEEMSAVCLRAIQIDPYDEGIHILLLESLLAQGKNAAALSHYEHTTDSLSRTLGVGPSPELREVYSQIMREQQSPETDLAIIQTGMSEYGADGAFVCDLGFFRQAYRLAERLCERTGQSAHVLLFTLSGKHANSGGQSLLPQAMDALLLDCRCSLRRTDVISKYSGTQFLALLPGSDYEGGLMVAERICAAFARRGRFRCLRLMCSVQPLGMAAECLDMLV